MDEQFDDADQSREPGGEPSERVDVTDSGRRRRWQIGVVACIALLVALAVGLRLAGDDSSIAAGPLVIAHVDCGDDDSQGFSMAIDGDGSGNGVATPGLALQDVATYTDGEFDTSGYKNEGLASAVGGSYIEPGDGTLLFVKRDGEKVVGQVLISPVGAGWRASAVHACR